MLIRKVQIFIGFFKLAIEFVFVFVEAIITVMEQSFNIERASHAANYQLPFPYPGIIL